MAEITAFRSVRTSRKCSRRRRCHLAHWPLQNSTSAKLDSKLGIRLIKCLFFRTPLLLSCTANMGCAPSRDSGRNDGRQTCTFGCCGCFSCSACQPCAASCTACQSQLGCGGSGGCLSCAGCKGQQGQNTAIYGDETSAVPVPHGESTSYPRVSINELLRRHCISRERVIAGYSSA